MVNQEERKGRWRNISQVADKEGGQEGRKEKGGKGERREN